MAKIDVRGGRAQVRSIWCAVFCTLNMSVVCAEDSPLFLSMSQTLTRDTNLLRDDTNRRTDYLSTTTLTAGLDKAYGRQNYRLSAAASKNHYRENSQYNNDGYSVSADINSEVADKFSVSVGGAASRFLPNFENLTNRALRNVQTNRQYQLDARYGLFGKLSVNASLGHSEVAYSIADAENKQSDTTLLGLRYSPTDLLNFGVSVSKTDTSIPNRVLVGVSSIGEDVRRTSVALNSSWVVTGFSRLYGSLAMTNERHPADSRRDFKGVTGSASWAYTPGGKMSYAASWVRDTSNEGGQTLGKNINADSVYSTSNRLNNTLTGSARWQATAKVAVNAVLTYARYQEDSGLGSSSVVTSTSENGRYKGYSLGVAYQPLRALGLGCDALRYNRTKSRFSLGYSGNTLACRASLSID